MAHDNNGRIYIDRTVTPNIGVSIGDIQHVLGTSDSDLGLLCSDQTWDKSVTPHVLVPVQRINPYSKIKPVSFASPASPTDAQRKAINYGITAPVPSSHPADTKNTLWTYTKPSGLPTDWFRIRDFEEYHHNATAPFVGRGDIDVTQAGGAVSLATFVNVVGSMTLQDYATLANYYLCVFLVGSSNGLPYIKTSDGTIGSNMSPVLTLAYSELTPFNNGTEYYLCLCDTRQTTLGSLPAGAKYLPIPRFRSDAISNFTGVITKQQGYDVTLSFDMLFGGNSPAIASNFTSPAPPTPNYFTAAPSPDPYGHIENEERYYFDVGSNTSLKVRFTVASASDTIYGNSIYARLSPTFYGSPTARQRVTVYKLVNGTVSIENGALSPGTTYIAALYADALVLNSSNQRGGPIPSATMKLRSTLELYDGGGENSVKIATTTFGLRNGTL